jgi:hypothetical protein
MANTSQEAKREPARAPAREQVRTPVLKAGEFLGRNGEILSRTKDYEDAFDVPLHMREVGWSYQWNRMSVYGKEDTAEMRRMQANGWRPIPAERFGETGDTSFVEREGLILMERPKGMTELAEKEEERKAATQYLGSFTNVDLGEHVPAMARTMQKRMARERSITIEPINQHNSIPADE